MKTNIIKKTVVVVKQGLKLVLKVAELTLDLVSWVFKAENWKLLVAAFDGSVAAVVSWFKDNVPASYISDMRAKFKKAPAATKAEMIRNKSYSILRLGE